MSLDGTLMYKWGDQFQTLLTPVDGVQKEPHIYLVGGRPTPLKNI